MPTHRSLPPASRAWPRPALGALGLLFTLAAGCASDSAGIPVACTGPDSCPPPSSAIGWAAQLWPSSSDGSDAQHPLAPQEIAQLRFDAGGTAVLQYRSPALSQGIVTNAESVPKVLLRARVLALLPTVIPGQAALTFNTLTANQLPGLWSLRIPVPEHPSSQPYRFWVGFDDAAQASLYPPVWHDQVVATDTMVPLSTRAAADLATVLGRITNPLGEGVGGLTVQVVDSANQIVSSTAVSQTAAGSTLGTYQLFVDPTLSTDSQANLRVVVRPGTASSTLPTLEVAMAPPRAGSATKVDFAFPSQRTPVSFQLPIRGLAASGTTMAVVGAHVQAQVQLQDQATQQLGVRAIYTATADTDAQGIAKLTLVPAPSGGGNLTYQVAITSPTVTPFASAQQAVAVGPHEGLLAPVSLPLRAQLLGRLLNAEGQPVASAQVVAQAIATDGQPPSPLGAATTDVVGAQTITDQDGHFALHLDPGDYDLDLVPVPGTQPRSSVDNQRIGTADIDVGDIRLPRITLGRLLVQTPGGAPVVGTKVRVFQLPDTTPRYGLACESTLPCSRVASLRAEAFTDRNGLAQFLLPDSTPQLAQPQLR
jgi:hypothetical protein